MKCRTVEKKISAYQDGELRREQREKVVNHLAGCAACREQFARLEALREALGALPEIRPESGFYRQVVKKINESQEQRRPWTILTPIYRFLRTPVLASLILLTGLAAGGYFGSMLARSVLMLGQSALIPAAQAEVIASVQAFDPAPPGTFAAGYLRLASYKEDSSR